MLISLSLSFNLSPLATELTIVLTKINKEDLSSNKEKVATCITVMSMPTLQCSIVHVENDLYDDYAP